MQISMSFHTIKNMIIGYARVSTLEQNEQLQTDALRDAGCDRIFVDHASGAKAHRPELDHLLDVIRKGDTLIAWKLDRLGRSVQNLVDLMNLLQSGGVGFKSLTENMDTTTPGGVLIFNMFAAMAQFERDLICERTNAGLQAARARGHVGGRPSKLNERQRTRIRELYQSRALTVQEIADQYQVSRQTIYSNIRA